MTRQTQELLTRNGSAIHETRRDKCDKLPDSLPAIAVALRVGGWFIVVTRRCYSARRETRTRVPFVQCTRN